MSNNLLDFDEENARALAEMLADPVTAESTKLQIINTLLESDGDTTFFETMFREAMSLAECAFCKTENHWSIPEDELNQMGWVSHERDKRIKQHTTKDDCPEFREACSKKKTTA